MKSNFYWFISLLLLATACTTEGPVGPQGPPGDGPILTHDGTLDYTITGTTKAGIPFQNTVTLYNYTHNDLRSTVWADNNMYAFSLLVNDNTFWNNRFSLRIVVDKSKPDSVISANGYLNYNQPFAGKWLEFKQQYQTEGEVQIQHFRYDAVNDRISGELTASGTNNTSGYPASVKGSFNVQVLKIQ